jgi:outer membrane receptor protein involved in Fe transport
MGRFQGALFAGAAMTMVMAGAAWAADPAYAPMAVKLEAGPLDAALLRLADQTQVKILFSSDLVAGRKIAALEGRYSARQALEHLLVGTGIQAQAAKPGVLILRPARQPMSTPPTPRVDRTAASKPSANDTPTPTPTRHETELVTEVSEIVVGSHIRGVRDGPSPVVVLDRAELDRAGYATVAEALTSQPQAFGGSTSDDTGTTGADPTTTNSSRATGVNLRGLGADATLVLINGRRMAGAGLMGDFADISAIPIAAVARVEILLDGASALYGSDAVGGVVNVVLRERFEGAETRARIGGSTHGDLGQHQLAQTFGHAWGSGSILVSGEYQHRAALAAVDRDYAGNADLRSLGGADHRNYFGQPGTILTVDPVSFALVPTYAIPSGQDGTALKPTDFRAGTKNLSNFRAQMSLLPSQERGSLYVALAQDVGSRVTLTADARYSDRRYTTYSIGPQTTLTVTSANPYFVSPNGSSSHYVAYSLGNETGGLKSTGEVQSRGVSIGAKIDLPADWRLDAYALHAEELAASRSTNMINSAFLNEALGNTADNPATAYRASVDGYFNPFIGTGRNKQSVLDFVTSGYETRRTVGRLDTVSATADGPLLRLPAGEIRLAAGVQARTENLKTIGWSAISGPAAVSAFSRFGERTVTAAFAEVRAPLFGDGFRRPGLERLDLSAAVRAEHYEGGATSTVPKLGVVWGPTRALNVKATYGESFRAPSLGEITDPQRATPVNISVNGGTILTLLRYGGNPDLRPETATSWTAGLEYAPPEHPGLRLSATYFDTNFKQRIGQPAINNLSTVLTAPDLAPFRQFIDPVTKPADLAQVQDLLKLASSAAATLYPAASYRAIADARYVNTGAFRVRGLDLTGSWGLTAFGDPLTVTGNASWLLSYQRKITQAAQAVELVGMTEYPADFRARLAATWTHGPFATTGAINHTGDLHTAAGARVDGQATVDLQVQWTSPARAGAWRGLSVALSAQNLFDHDPPFYDSPVGVGYDPANYEPTGRMVALQLTKAW